MDRQIQKDANGYYDISITNSDFVMLDGADEVAQRVVNRTTIHPTDLVLQPGYGIDPLDIVLETPTMAKNQATAMFTSQVNDIDGVVGFSEPIKFIYDIETSSLIPEMSIIISGGETLTYRIT